MIEKLIIVSIIVFCINIPFGYWRANVKKLSLQWVLAVHIPVPFIIALRFLVSIGFAWYTYLFLVSAFFFGQLLGANLLKINKQKMIITSSCLIMDIIHELRN